jgi:hypothetical protein
MDCECCEKIDALEKKIDQLLAITMDTQLSIHTKNSNLENRKKAMAGYVENMTAMFKAKGLDTTMFDQFKPFLEGES